MSMHRVKRHYRVAEPKRKSVYDALVTGTRDYIKTRFQRWILGLSGGIDSALVRGCG